MGIADDLVKQGQAPPRGSARKRCIEKQEAKLVSEYSASLNDKVRNGGEGQRESKRIAAMLLSAVANSNHEQKIDGPLLEKHGLKLGKVSDRKRGRDGKPKTSSAKRGKPSNSESSKSSEDKAPKPKGKDGLIPIATEIAVWHKQGWILGRVVKFMQDERTYLVQDVDDESEKFSVPRTKICKLTTKGKVFQSGQRVLAVYPQSTVFYPGTLTERGKGGWKVLFDEEDYESNVNENTRQGSQRDGGDDQGNITGTRMTIDSDANGGREGGTVHEEMGLLLFVPLKYIVKMQKPMVVPKRN